MKKYLIAILIVFTLSGCAKDVPYETISLDEMEEKLADGYVLLDVREVDEFYEGHIPGAINKPLSALQEDDFSHLSKDEKYIVICRSGNRSITASELLSEEGYEVINTSEGVSTWNGELEK